MSISTTNMGLTSWNSPSDTFDNTELADNWTAIDTHDHTSGKGVQIPTGGIVNLAVTSGKLATSAVTNGKISPSAVTTDKIADGTITAADLSALPAARVTNSIAESIPDSTATDVTFDTERFDTDTIHSTGSFTERLTCKTAGVYLIWGGLSYAANATGIRRTAIRLNGSSIIARNLTNASSSLSTDHTISTIYSLAVNDYVTLQAYQTSGGALNAAATTNLSPEFGMVRVG